MVSVIKLVTHSLLFNEGLKIQGGCQSCKLILATNIVSVRLSTVLKQLELAFTIHNELLQTPTCVGLYKE